MKTHLTITTNMMTMFRVLMPLSFFVSVKPIRWWTRGCGINKSWEKWLRFQISEIGHVHTHKHTHKMSSENPFRMINEDTNHKTKSPTKRASLVTVFNIPFLFLKKAMRGKYKKNIAKKLFYIWFKEWKQIYFRYLLRRIVDRILFISLTVIETNTAQRVPRKAWIAWEMTSSKNTLFNTVTAPLFNSHWSVICDSLDVAVIVRRSIHSRNNPRYRWFDQRKVRNMLRKPLPSIFIFISTTPTLMIWLCTRVPWESIKMLLSLFPFTHSTLHYSII